MGCFIVPAAEAVVITAAEKIVEKREKNETKKLKWLSNLLWGGSALLAFEHVWHGEVVPWFPFLTAAENPQSLMEMLHEMATTGVGMTLLVTGVWVLMVLVTGFREKLEIKTEKNMNVRKE